MSMRRLSVLTDALPDGGHVWAALTGEPPGWSVEALLLADLFHAVVGKPHPAREKSAQARSKSGRRVTDLSTRLMRQRARRTGGDR